MNLLAKRAGLLFFSAVLIFLISCEDDSYLLGIKGKTKFQGVYHEIVFDGTKSSVVLLDSVFTDQYAVSALPINPSAYRFLLGQYEDPVFGVVRSELFAGYLPNDLIDSPTKLINPQKLDSVTVQLLFDFYAYGPQWDIKDSVVVYELTDTLSFFTRYITGSTAVHKDVPVGALRFKKLVNGIPRPITLTQLKYKEQLDRDPAARDTFLLHGRLNLQVEDLQAFEENLYNHLVLGGDSVLIGPYIPAFRKEFPGFAFVPIVTGRMLGYNTIGYNTRDPFSRVTIYYHSSTLGATKTSLYFSPGAAMYANAFSNITTQRIGDLAGLTVPSEQYFPGNDPNSTERYIQDGTAAITELDLSDFYSFVDSLEDIVINSAEITLDVKDVPPGISPPPSLYGMLMKKDGSKIIPLDIEVKEDSLKMVQFLGNIFTDLHNFAIAPELSAKSPLTLDYNGNTGRYSGYATMFFQKLFNNKSKSGYNIERIGLYPATAPILKILPGQTTGSPVLKSGVGNSVNRVVLTTSGMKLKLYYTVPNKPNLE